MLTGLLALPPLGAIEIRLPGQIALVQSWDLGSPSSVAYNAFDGFGYVGNRDGAVFQLDPGGTATQIGTNGGGDVAGLAADPVTGDIYATNDFEGGLYRFDGSDGWARSTAVSSVLSGDDDTAGVTVLPPGYTGSIAPAGTGFFTDRNNTGNDYLFSFLNPAEPTGAHTTTELARSDNQPATDPAGFATPNGGASAWIDLAASRSDLFLADDGQEHTGGGQIYRVGDTGELEPLLPTGNAITLPRGIAAPWDSDILYVTDNATQGLYRFDPETAEEALLVDGFSSVFWGSVATDPAGSRIWVADRDQVYAFAVIPEPAHAAGLLALFAACAVAVARRRLGGLCGSSG